MQNILKVESTFRSEVGTLRVPFGQTIPERKELRAFDWYGLRVQILKHPHSPTHT